MNGPTLIEPITPHPESSALTLAGQLIGALSSQPQKVRSGLEANVDPSLSYSAQKVFKPNKFFKIHKISLDTNINQKHFLVTFYFHFNRTK